MPAEIIPCPACQHDVRVPESLFGQPVRCPSCKAYFLAPMRDADGQMGAAHILPERPIDAIATNASTAERSLQIAEDSTLNLPAILLLLVGIIGTLVNGYQAISTIADPAAARRGFIEVQKQAAQMTKREFDEKVANQVADVMPALTQLMFLVSVIPLAGAIAMLLRRSWWLAVVGSAVAMINIANCCCLLGMPVGIYCLIKLLDPEVRPLFRQI